MAHGYIIYLAICFRCIAHLFFFALDLLSLVSLQNRYKMQDLSAAYSFFQFSVVFRIHIHEYDDLCVLNLTTNLFKSKMTFRVRIDVEGLELS